MSEPRESLIERMNREHPEEMARARAQVYAEGERERLIEALRECIETARELRRYLVPSGFGAKPCDYATYRRIWDASKDAQTKGFAALTWAPPSVEETP